MESSSGTVVAAVNVSAVHGDGGLFKTDKATHMFSVQTFVVLTTLLLVVRFLLDFLGPWNKTWSLTLILVLALEALNNSLVHYTMGLMQLSAARVNDYFQVWAVLLITLQYSVKTGRPYSRSKQIPLLDLMSSLWAANLLRVQTTSLLRIPLWLIWSLNAARIISYFASSKKAEAINQESLRLTTDYMSYEHEIITTAGGGSHQLSADADGDTAPPPPPPPDSSSTGMFTMESYKYLVIGEDQVLKDLQLKAEGHVIPSVQAQQRRNKYQVRLDPRVHEKLITVDKIWNVDGGESGILGGTADPSNRLKDVCLSFALYKLLRRRFHDLPLHEGRLPARQGSKVRRLVFEYVLQDAERAFRVVGTEISFLQDQFYSRHAATFARGFPAANLVLSLLLVVATGYIAYPVRFIPERIFTGNKAAEGKDDDGRTTIARGVLITRVIIALIAGKELAEIYMYVFSQWTKVLMLCSYAKRRCLRHPLVEGAMRVLLFFMIRGTRDEKICQHNILISTRAVKLPRLGTCWLWSKLPVGIRMEACTKEAIFQSIRRRLERSPESTRLDLYFTDAFGGPNDQRLHRQLLWAVNDLEADTHRILVWHIATCLCEIDLASDDQAAALRPVIMRPGPFVKGTAAAWWEHYATAASLSNYCAYMVTQGLVPDHGLLTRKVLTQVRWEIWAVVTLDGSIGSLLKLRSMRDVFTRLMRTAAATRPHKQASAQGKPDVEKGTKEERSGDPRDIGNTTLTSMGATLARQLMDEYGEDRVGLWEKLAVLWTGFLLHLAASTRASKHRRALAGRRELTTHLWALLSHAGFLGTTSHGQAALELEDRLAALDERYK